ncbi:SET domain-containing protein [Lachnellula occidentalis]|uniref:SET domain-containing protein n=1 Tax=Lachnellula occidentalis TaxID=215460 RepID=A0A8H8SAQ1_9HELO|nr:SET domain-containing protein [Lachnellula occidentalis]
MYSNLIVASTSTRAALGMEAATMEKGIPLKREEGLVLIMDTPKGRGVFAGKHIPARTVIEVSPVLVLDPVENKEHIEKTDLYNYTYNWPYTPPQLENGNGNGNSHVNGSGKPPSTTQAVVLGLGSMFNHSNRQQNVGWERDLTHCLVTYTALRDIREGEELCISYGSRLTFKDMDGDDDSFEREPDDMEEWLYYTDLID